MGEWRVEPGNFEDVLPGLVALNCTTVLGGLRYGCEIAALCDCPGNFCPSIYPAIQGKTMLAKTSTQPSSPGFASNFESERENSTAQPISSEKLSTGNIVTQLSIFVGRLNHQLNSAARTYFDKSWAQARATLDAMPLGTDRYDVAVSRLNNCLRYAKSGETGAAKYELKLLCGYLDLAAF